MVKRRTDPGLTLRLLPQVLIRFDIHPGRSSLRLDPSLLLAAAGDWLERHAREPLRGLVWRRLHDPSLLPRAATAPTLGPPCEDCGARQESLVETQPVLRIETRDGLAAPRVGLWAALAMARVTAGLSAGMISDEHQRRLLEPTSLDRPIPADGAIEVSRHIMYLHSLSERGAGWITSIGMAKFGLLDLEIEDAPPDLTSGCGAVVNAMAQRLVAQVMEAAGKSPPPLEVRLGPEVRLHRGDLARAAGGGATPQGEAGEGEAGEGETGVPGPAIRLAMHASPRVAANFISLNPPRGFIENRGVWLHEVVKALVGAREDTVLGLCSGHQHLLDEAHRKAMAELPRVKQRFQKGLPVGETLLVKHGFAAPDGFKEYMWVAVRTWTGPRLQGQLSSRPVHCPELRPGQPIEIDESEVFDWVLHCADGTHAGAYTDKVIEECSEGGEDR